MAIVRAILSPIGDLVGGLNVVGTTLKALPALGQTVSNTFNSTVDALTSGFTVNTSKAVVGFGLSPIAASVTVDTAGTDVGVSAGLNGVGVNVAVPDKAAVGVKVGPLGVDVGVATVNTGVGVKAGLSGVGVSVDLADNTSKPDFAFEADWDGLDLAVGQDLTNPVFDLHIPGVLSVTNAAGNILTTIGSVWDNLTSSVTGG